MISICIWCDQCGVSAFVATYKQADGDTVIQAAKRAGWSVPRDKGKGNDKCPVCIAKEKKSVYYR